MLKVISLIISPPAYPFTKEKKDTEGNTKAMLLKSALLKDFA
jgi:hypothetical protein